MLRQLINPVTTAISRRPTLYFHHHSPISALHSPLPLANHSSPLCCRTRGKLSTIDADGPINRVWGDVKTVIDRDTKQAAQLS